MGNVETTTDGSGNLMLMLNDLSGTVNGILEAMAPGYNPSSRPLSLSPGDSVMENFNLTV